MGRRGRAKGSAVCGDLWVHPLVLGSGDRPFDGAPTAGLELVDTTTLSDGIVILRYRLAT